MPENAQPFFNRVAVLSCCTLRNLIIVCSSVSSFLIAGCGGGEDFSKPPAQIQGRLANVAADSAASPAPDSATDDGTIPKGDVAHLDLKQSGNNSTEPSGDIAGSEATAVDSAATNAPVSTNGETPIVAATAVPAEPVVPTEPSTSAPASGDGTEVMTASGKSAAEIAAKTEANSAKSVMGNAGGLLGSLKSGGTKANGAAARSAPTSAPDQDAPQITTRFGRLALSRLQWLQLVSQMTRQFFIASTPSGNHLAGSVGERSLEVLDTQLDLRSQLLNADGNRPSQAGANSVQIPVTGIPGIINSLELTDDGQQILVGTTDGRLLVRSSASTADWDLFARDLFRFQAEHRRTARISNSAVVAIRSLPDDQILTIDADGLCAFWKLSDVALPVTPILEMTVDEARAAEAETVTVTPMSSFPVSGYEILNITICETCHLGAVITSSEEVYIFRTNTGELVETLKADVFADTQPVCIDFIADGTEILVGLADGRILRRARTGSPAVNGLNDQGETTDYEIVFVPDVQDQVGSITSIRAIPNSRTIYFGTIDGTVVRFDSAQKRIEQSKKRHTASVIDFCVTEHGVLSIGGDRLAQLFDIPMTPQSVSPDSEAAFQLPRDETLEETGTDDSQPQNGTVVLTSRSTRPTRSRGTETPVAVDLSLAGIRPGDATLALYAHQLRSADGPAKKLELRKQILKHRGENSLADSLGMEQDEIPDGPPLRIGDITTQLQFGSGEWTRILLAISDDGTTAGMTNPGAQNQKGNDAGGLYLYDLTTGITLRHWNQTVTTTSLTLNGPHHALLPSPANTRFWHTTGYAETNPLRPIFTSVMSADSHTLIAGNAGTVGIAQPALTRINLNERFETNGLELFESMITAAAFSSAGDRLLVGTRERDQVRLLELAPVTFAIQQVLAREQLHGRISEKTGDRTPSEIPGTSFIQCSPTDKLMLTWGNYDGGSQLRLWRRGGAGWLPEEVSVIRAAEATPDFKSNDRPVTFVNQQDGRLAILTATGLVTLATKKAEVERMIPIPNVNGHRPPCVFTPDGKWLLTGDGHGNVWAVSLMSLDRKPIKFEAHVGPVAGLAISANGQYLATISEDNHLRSWRVDGFLKR